MMRQKIKICARLMGASARVEAIVRAAGRWNVKFACFHMIGLPSICVGSSLKAWKELKSKAMKIAPPRVKAPAALVGIWWSE